MHLIAATTSTLFQGQRISCLAGTTATVFCSLVCIDNNRGLLSMQ